MLEGNDTKSYHMVVGEGESALHYQSSCNDKDLSGKAALKIFTSELVTLVSSLALFNERYLFLHLFDSM